MSDGGLIGGSFDQHAAMVSGAQSAQAELGRGEVIDAGLEPGEIAADQIEFDFVERSSAGGGAKVDFAAGIFSVPGDAGREVEQLGDRCQIRRALRFAGNDFGDGGEGGDSGLAEFCRQGRGLQRGINLERDGLVVEVQRMLIVADAGVGVLGGVVVVQGDFGIAVIGHVAVGRTVTPIYNGFEVGSSSASFFGSLISQRSRKNSSTMPFGAVVLPRKSRE